MFYNVPAGLCVYIITSGAWSMMERKLLPKPKLASGASASTVIDVKPSSTNGASWISPVKKKGKTKK
jgi:membrane protein insertase Oxa1/YidC/SpoIIIJ